MLTKTDLIDGLSECYGAHWDHGMTKNQAGYVVDWLFERIGADLAEGGGVILRGFGKIYATDRKAGVGKNPRTGEPIQIAAKRTARFRPGKALAEQMNAS